MARELEAARRHAASPGTAVLGWPTMTFDPNLAAAPDSGIFGLGTSEDDAGLVLVPVPWEATTSYGRGTAGGPEAIAAASLQLDLCELELERPYEVGIY